MFFDIVIFGVQHIAIRIFIEESWLWSFPLEYWRFDCFSFLKIKQMLRHCISKMTKIFNSTWTKREKCVNVKTKSQFSNEFLQETTTMFPNGASSIMCFNLIRAHTHHISACRSTEKVCKSFANRAESFHFVNYTCDSKVK